MRTIVLVTGGFDPLHSGHISYLTEAKKLGDLLIVGVNSDDWLTRKKGKPFMPINDRINIIQNLKMVDGALLFNDGDNSAKQAIKNVRQLYPYDKIIFANGGDRTDTNIPEMDFYDPLLDFAFKVGGEEKMNSSSWILEEWKVGKTPRSWGYYRVLHDRPGYKVKELVVDPYEKLSLQRHFKRSELWFVVEGTADILYQGSYKWKIKVNTVLEKDDHFLIGIGTWHQLANNHDAPLKVIEIQYGEECTEDDIERDEEDAK